MVDIISGEKQGKFWEWIALTALLYGLIGLIFGPLTLIVAVHQYHNKTGRRRWLILLSLAVMWFFFSDSFWGIHHHPNFYSMVAVIHSIISNRHRFTTWSCHDFTIS